MHINELEILALKLALETFLKAQEIKLLDIQMDNIVALSYFLKIALREKCLNMESKVSKISGPYFPVLGLNTGNTDQK